MLARRPLAAWSLALPVLAGCATPVAHDPRSGPPRREAPRPAAPLRVGELQAEVARVTTAGLAGHAVVGLAVTADGRVVAGTDRTLLRLEGETWRPWGAPPGPVQALLARGSELLVVAGGQLLRLGPDGRCVAQAPVPERAVALAARDERVLLASARAVFELREGALQPRAPLPLEADEQVLALAAGPDREEVLVGTSAGLLRGDGAGWTRLFPAQGRRSWAPRQVAGLAVEPGGRVWLACAAGLCAREPDGSWRLWDGEQGLPWAGFVGLALAGDGAVWLGTDRGAIRFHEGRWSYRQGRRWLPDDRVTALAVGPDGAAWFATASGVGAIERRPLTLAAKAAFFERELERRHLRTRFGYVGAVRLADPRHEDAWTQEDSDNDGLWTAMYGAGECFAWAATGDPSARERARRAFEALRQLVRVSAGGEHPAPRGFPARSILPTDGPDPNARHTLADDARKRAAEDGLWKLIHPRWPRSGDGEWFWKCDTSSDELDGHFFFYAQYHDLVADDAERARVREVVCAIVDHLLDHDLRLVDWDGQPTRWANFAPASLDRDPDWWEERGLNSLSILSYLAVAAHVSGDPRYRRAARELIERHGYAMNVLSTKVHQGPGTGNQSDDEMACMSFYDLLLYEDDPALRETWGLACARWFELERPEQNPLFAFACAASLAGARARTPWGELELGRDAAAWCAEAAEALARLPLDRRNWGHRNSHRLDLLPLPDEGSPRGRRRDGTAIPCDERHVEHWNVDPWRLDTAGDGTRLGDGAVFLLPYWMGRYHGFLAAD